MKIILSRRSEKIYEQAYLLSPHWWRLEMFTRRSSQNCTRPIWALKFDVKKFFDSVDHQILLSLLTQRVSCTKTNDLLVGIVNSFALQEQRPWGVTYQVWPSAVYRSGI